MHSQGFDAIDASCLDASMQHCCRFTPATQRIGECPIFQGCYQRTQMPLHHEAGRHMFSHTGAAHSHAARYAGWACRKFGWDLSGSERLTEARHMLCILPAGLSTVPWEGTPEQEQVCSCQPHIHPCRIFGYQTPHACGVPMPPTGSRGSKPKRVLTQYRPRCTWNRPCRCCSSAWRHLV